MKIAMGFGCAVLISLSAAASAGSKTDSTRSQADASQAAELRSATDRFSYQRYVLSNGLTILVNEDHKTPVVAVHTWYHVGSKNEGPGRSGFAHLFEHLMFEGSEHQKMNFDYAISEFGASGTNGSTHPDYTEYVETVPAAALDRALWMEADRMGHLLGALDQANLDRQREVVQNERREHYDNAPYGKLGDLIPKLSYPEGHPYSWPVIGSMRDLNNATLADVKDWFHQFYGPGNAVIAISGDVSAEEVRAKVEHYFGGIEAGPPVARIVDWIAPFDSARRMQVQDNVPQIRVQRFWNTPPARADDNTRLNLVADVLGGGASSRLYRRLVLHDQLATGASASMHEAEIGSQFVISVPVKAGVDPARVETAIDEELQKFNTKGPDPEELERTRTETLAGWIRDGETVSGKAEVLAYGQIFAGTPDFFQDYLRVLLGATPDDLRHTAARWLTDRNLAVETVPFGRHSTAADVADPAVAPPIGSTPDFVLPALQRTTLPNGLQLVVAERHDAPLVQFDLIIKGGLASEPAEHPGLAGFTLAMLSQGTATRDVEKISDDRERLGMSFHATMSPDHFFVGSSALTMKLEESLELYSDLLLHPGFPDAAIEREKTQRIAALTQIKTTASGAAFNLLPTLVYGDHPYAKPRNGLGTLEGMQRITAEALRSFHREHFRPDQTTLLVTGDITTAQTLPLVKKYFASWQAPATDPVRVDVSAVPQSPSPRVFLIDRPDSVQSFIAAADLGPSRRDPDYSAMRTASKILGSATDSRLNRNLRNDKHWSYGASSSYDGALGPGLFTAGSQVERAHTADALVEIHNELVGITGSRPITTAELDAAKVAQTLTLPAANETIAEVANSFSNILAFGLPDDYYSQLIKRIGAYSESDVVRGANKIVHPEQMTYIVVGDLRTIEAPIRKLDLGEVIVMDADGKRLPTQAAAP